MSYKVMQLETSNYCSLKCVYCPHPAQHRPKGNMSFETFKKCMTLVSHSDNPVHKDGRKFVWLNHFGEPLLHPMLPEFINYAKSCGIKVSFASNAVDENGNLFPQSLWRQLASAGLEDVMLSAHTKNERILRDHVGGIVRVRWLWTPTRGNFHDWAGQVDMTKFKLEPIQKPSCRCDYETNNMFAVTWDGRLASCCYDSEGRVGLCVDDVLQNGFEFREVSLCATCRLGRGDASWLSDF